MALDQFDFGVFVFSSDDSVTSRGKTQRAVRDNVLFELGLFVGRLGIKRSFVVAPNDPDLRIPSDLLGWIFGKYDQKKENLQGALGAVCFKIKKSIEKEGPKQEPKKEVSNKTLVALSRRIDELTLRSQPQGIVVIRDIGVQNKKLTRQPILPVSRLPKKPVLPIDAKSKSSTKKSKQKKPRRIH